MADEQSYFEMLWNCETCQTQGLLAKSQRHCPQCGAAQDPAKRYFPEPGSEVEVQGHQFVGVDWRCAYCQSPNGAAAAFCANCGAGQDGSKPVATIADPTDIPAAAPTAPAKSNSKRGLMIGIAIVIALLGLVASLFLTKRETSVEVTQRSWERSIAIERMSAVNDSAWCDALPSGAYSVSQSREVRSHRKIADGQDCTEKRVDMGDGTFSKRKECSTRYREEPVYDQRCHFRINRWQTARQVKSDQLASPAPTWPGVGFLQGGGSGLGAEREGARRESYTLTLTAGDKHWTCDVPEAVWSRYQEGATVPLKVRLTGGADCGSLR